MAAVNPNIAVASISPTTISRERPIPLSSSQEDAQASRIHSPNGERVQSTRNDGLTADTETVSPVTSDEPGREELHSIAESFGQVVSAVNKGISIRIDEKADMFVTEIVNKETNEVIKQIPPEQLVRLAGRLREFLGILLDIEV